MLTSFSCALYTQHCVYVCCVVFLKKKKICLEPHQEHELFSLDEEDTVNSSDQIKKKKRKKKKLIQVCKVNVTTSSDETKYE